MFGYHEFPSLIWQTVINMPDAFMITLSNVVNHLCACDVPIVEYFDKVIISEFIRLRSLYIAARCLANSYHSTVASERHNCTTASGPRHICTFVAICSKLNPNLTGLLIMYRLTILAMLLAVPAGTYMYSQLFTYLCYYYFLSTSILVFVSFMS